MEARHINKCLIRLPIISIRKQQITKEPILLNKSKGSFNHQFLPTAPTML